MQIDTILQIIQLTDRVLHGVITLAQWQQARDSLILELETIRERSGEPTSEDYARLLQRMDTAYQNILKRKEEL